MSEADNSLRRETLMRELDESWNEFLNFITSLSPQQLTEPSDAAGWTAKDHIIHLALWEKAGLALLEGKSKRETLDITPEIWEQDDDPINAVLQERYRDMPLDEVMKTLHERHAQTMKKLNSMSEEDLLLPYSHYQPQSDIERPIMLWLFNDTIDHYREHIPWIKAIVGAD